jgi:DNA-binding protein HU-beta
MTSSFDRHATLENLSPETVLTGPQVVSLELTPEDLSTRAELEWSEQDTELGLSDLAVLRLGSGGPRFALRRYRESSFPTIDLSADGEATSADIDNLLAALRVRPREILDRVDPDGTVWGAAAQSKASRGSVSQKPHSRAAASRERAAPRMPRNRPRMAPLIEAVAADSGLSKTDATRAIESFVATVSETLRKGDEVAITGFGKFSVFKRRARQGVNPRTGEKVKIRASKAPKFTPGTGLKQAVGGKRSQ